MHHLTLKALSDSIKRRTYRTPWALHYRKRLLQQTWETVLDVQMGASAGREGARTGGFQLIYNGGGGDGRL